MKGIDVSHNNGVINWSRVKAAGIDFVMIRATHGTSVDRQFLYNIKNAMSVGLDVGLWCFSYAVSRAEAIVEAKFFLNTIKLYKLTYPCAFDYEYYSVEVAKKKGIKITPVIACDIADGFMSEIAKAGYYIINYTNKDFTMRYFTQPCMGKYEKWIATWASVKPTNITGIWQNEVRGSLADVNANPPRASVVGSLSGVSGAIDMDISYKDYPTIIRSLRLNHLATVAVPVSAPVAKSVVKPVIKPVPVLKPLITFKKGDKAKVINITTVGGVKRGKTYEGGTFVVYHAVYNVISVSGNRVCIGIGRTITAAVTAVNLEKVNK